MILSTFEHLEFCISGFHSRKIIWTNLRTSSQTTETSDTVFYKRNTSNNWTGPGKVIKQNGKTKFVCHGSIHGRAPNYHLLKKGDKNLVMKTSKRALSLKLSLMMKSLSQNLWSKKNNLMVNLNHQNKQNHWTQMTMNLLFWWKIHLIFSKVKLMIPNKKKAAAGVLVLKRTSHYSK